MLGLENLSLMWGYFYLFIKHWLVYSCWEYGLFSKIIYFCSRCLSWQIGSLVSLGCSITVNSSTSLLNIFKFLFYFKPRIFLWVLLRSKFSKCKKVQAKRTLKKSIEIYEKWINFSLNRRFLTSSKRWTWGRSKPEKIAKILHFQNFNKRRAVVECRMLMWRHYFIFFVSWLNQSGL